MSKYLIHLVYSFIGIFNAKVYSRFLNDSYFSKMQIVGNNIETTGSLFMENPTRIAFGNNIKFKGKNYIDGKGGVVLGEGVSVGKSVTFHSFSRSNNQEIFDPIVVQPYESIENNTIVNPGSMLGVCDFDKGLLNFKGDLVFIIGTGRSGTNSISEFLNQNDNSICYHDPFPHIGLWSCDLLYKKSLENEIVTKLKFLYNTIESKEYKLVGQSDQKFGAIIPQLSKVFPKAKFIWLIRNGYDFINSTYPRGWFRNSEFGYDINNNEFFEAKAKPSRMHAYCRINAFKLGLMSEKEWKSMTAFERNCWYWNYWNSLIEKDLLTIKKENQLFVRLEEIQENRELLEKFLGISFKQDIKKTNKARYSRISKNEWNKEMKSLFLKHCGDSMDKWYPNK